ncbi:MAG: winged helix-turn-helix transcriptional regulator [Solirubrobacteraceae bacterium]
MPYRPFDRQNCSIAATLAIIGERWTLLVMREVLLGRRRFAEIRTELCVAPNILSDRLDTLVDHDLLQRRRYGKHPEALEYVPTEKGVDLNPVLVTLMQWGDRYLAPDGPPRVHVDTVCGHDAAPQLHCSHCGDPLSPDRLKVRPGPGANAKQRAEGVLP